MADPSRLNMADPRRPPHLGNFHPMYLPSRQVMVLGLGGPERWAGLLGRLRSLPWPELYRKGPIGIPQPFRMEHGEWGPPMLKSSELDWELYSVVLICCDVLLTLIWHYMAATTLAQVRVKWMSPTFRVSIGYMFGTFRLSIVRFRPMCGRVGEKEEMQKGSEQLTKILARALAVTQIIYFFRAEPYAAYTHLHILSFILHCSFGLVALLFGDGPWGHLRPNNFGQLDRDHQLNLYAMLRSFIQRSRSHLEFLFWGSVQWFVTTFPKGSSWLSAATLHLAPGKVSDVKVIDGISPYSKLTSSHFSHSGSDHSLVGNGFDRIVRMRRSLAQRFTSPKNCAADLPASVSSKKTKSSARPSLEVDTHTQNKDGVESVVLKDVDIPDMFRDSSSRNDAECCPEPVPSISSDAQDLDPNASGSPAQCRSGPLVDLSDEADMAPYWEAIHPQSDLARVNETSAAQQNQTNRWFMSEQDSFNGGQGNVVLVGPANVRINVSQSKWNESLLFWAMPSIAAYFSQKVNASLARDGSENNRNGGSPSWSAVDAFVNRSSPSVASEDSDSDGDDDFGESGVYGRPVRGTVQLRGDGTLLAITTAPPCIRSIYKVARNNEGQPPETREFVVELVGRRVRCKSGRKVIYTYAEYRSFGIHLTQAPSATLLWLLNKLNGEIRVPMLRVFRHECM
ncbi:Hypothetical Protein FCC1311_024222 [Hondaea fermentalgiana]|uniref:Uncharacterized protein n=1 Tax=Hondaea fermentalgiana TaxID=2315210 RepID=A0A2R5GDE7_9STRA|nr:Hypothetical Protein FCC1311_024222 [Hondaea fermentalgiana]|eukprot:GBG26201.1 Hypothetical Protein FCC1311_024222 [Hondaea fermentalgiana]